MSAYRLQGRQQPPRIRKNLARRSSAPAGPIGGPVGRAPTGPQQRGRPQPPGLRTDIVWPRGHRSPSAYRARVGRIPPPEARGSAGTEVTTATVAATPPQTDPPRRRRRPAPTGRGSPDFIRSWQRSGSGARQSSNSTVRLPSAWPRGPEAALADLLHKLGRHEEARAAFEVAAAQAGNRRDLLRRRAAEAANATTSS
jgi:hypothetical protein